MRYVLGFGLLLALAVMSCGFGGPSPSVRLGESHRGGLGGLAAESVAGIPARGKEATTPVNAPLGDPARTKRVMIYNAELYIVVDNVADALTFVNDAARTAGGHMQSLDPDLIVIKVPVAKFEQTIAEIEKLGEVTRKSIKGVDVTEEMRDLKIRLANAERVRDRFLALLEKSTKVEEALKVEKELERITREIELLKGKIRYLAENIALSTITVRLNRSVPHAHIVEEIPFPWVLSLAADLKKGATRPRYWHHGRKRGLRFKLPEGYIKYSERNYQTWAMSADKVFIKVNMHDNYEGGKLAFWGKLVRRVLTAKHVISIKDEKDLTLRTRMGVKLYIGAREIGKKKFGYLIAVASNRKYVYTFEAWGPQAEFDADVPKLEAALETLYIKP